MNDNKIYLTLSKETCVSHYNHLQAARESLSLPDKVLIRDATLREGEQASFSGWSLDDKVEIARLLDDTGIDIIQLGYPGYSESETQIAKRIAKEGLSAKLDGLCLVFIPEWKEQITAAAEAGIDTVSIVYGMSDIRIRVVNKVSGEDALTRCREAIEYATKQGLSVQFSPTDTTRMELGFLLEACKQAIDVGAESICIADTAGAASPAAIRFLVEEVREAINVPIAIHCHNDFGLAVANSIAAVEAGAEIADVTVNGLGERAGNAPLDEVVMTLKHLYGFDLKIKSDKFQELARRVSELSGMKIPPNKPLTGDFAFTHTVGTHQWGIRENWYVYEPIQAEAVGNRRRLPLGRLAYYLSVGGKLMELGISIRDEDILKKITEKVRAIAEEKRDFVSDEELVKVVDEFKQR
jgi:isopropylmalate/homocitrate/citramalate synthase